MTQFKSEAKEPDRNHLVRRAFRDWGWMMQGLCHGRLSLFFSERNSTNRRGGLLPNEKKAKALCARCPVRKECLTYATTSKTIIGLDGVVRTVTVEPYGIWGGAMSSERRGDIDVDELLDTLFEQAVRLKLVEREVA